MAKWKSWFDRVKKKLLSFETKSKPERTRRRRRLLFGSLKSGCSPVLPASSSLKATSLREVEKEQSKHALAVAVATAAAAEAAAAAAQAAAEVVRLTGTPSYHRSRQIAAIKIQAAFRGYLARRALRALKGLVRLQALVRGQAVRRKTAITLRGLQSLMKIQSLTCASRVRIAEDHQACDGNDLVHRKPRDIEDIKTMLQESNERRWEGSILSKEEVYAIQKSRREAALKRERAIEYASAHQERINARRPTTPSSKELDFGDLNHRWSWLEQWVGSQSLERDIPEVDPSPDEKLHHQELLIPDSPICLDSDNKDKAEETQLRYLARRSFSRSGRASTRDDDTFLTSPSFPNYMASTASAKARFRSLSTPKQRVGMMDICCDQCSPYRNRPLSPFPSITSDASLSKTKPSVFNQRSPCLKGFTVPVKIQKSSKYLSFDSGCSLPNWDRHDAFR